MLLDREKVDVEIVDIEPFSNEHGRGLTIYWQGSIGFGEYTIYKNAQDDKWRADSEYMDSKEDIWFLDKLYEKFKGILEEIR